MNVRGVVASGLVMMGLGIVVGLASVMAWYMEPVETRRVLRRCPRRLSIFRMWC